MCYCQGQTYFQPETSKPQVFGGLQSSCEEFFNAVFHGFSFLASQDAIEVMSVTDLLSVLIDLTDVTLVSDDTCSDVILTLMKVIWWWKLSSDESYLVMKVI